jgi:hypothetical protein
MSTGRPVCASSAAIQPAISAVPPRRELYATRTLWSFIGCLRDTPSGGRGGDDTLKAGSGGTLDLSLGRLQPYLRVDAADPLGVGDHRVQVEL